MIAYFAVGISSPFGKLIFLFVMISFTVLQWRTDPFSNKASNQAEFILLCALPMVIVTQFDSFQVDSLDTTVEVVLSILILFPVPLFCFFWGRVLHKGFVGYSAAKELEENTLEDGVRREKGHSTSDMLPDDGDGAVTSTTLKDHDIHDKVPTESAMSTPDMHGVASRSMSGDGDGDGDRDTEGGADGVNGSDNTPKSVEIEMAGNDENSVSL